MQSTALLAFFISHATILVYVQDAIIHCAKGMS